MKAVNWTKLNLLFNVSNSFMKSSLQLEGSRAITGNVNDAVDTVCDFVHDAETVVTTGITQVVKALKPVGILFFLKFGLEEFKFVMTYFGDICRSAVAVRVPTQ